MWMWESSIHNFYFKVFFSNLYFLKIFGLQEIPSNNIIFILWIFFYYNLLHSFHYSSINSNTISEIIPAPQYCCFLVPLSSLSSAVDWDGKQIYICFIQSLNNNILSRQTLVQRDVQSVKPKHVFKDLFAKSEGAFGLYWTVQCALTEQTTRIWLNDKKLKS